MTENIRTIAPAKAILFGEHAVNRGQAALAVSVGLYASCQLGTGEDGQAGIAFLTNKQQELVSHEELHAFAHMVDGFRAREEYRAIEALASQDFFAGAKYVTAALVEQLPASLRIELTSAIPHGAGLGSGGAVFVALATALSALIGESWDEETQRKVALRAWRGDILAHGGTASGLDTQTSLYGGAIRYTLEKQGEPIAHAPGLRLVIGNTGIYAPTSGVNARVRSWLAQQPVRLHYFQQIGLLSRHGEAAVRDGDWAELGRLLNLNQLVLERIGVSCPELERLNMAALEAGALGAKLSGSGGGGIMLALVTEERERAVAAAIEAAGGTALIAPIGVAGVTLLSQALS